MKVNCIKNTAERCNEKYRLHETKSNGLWIKINCKK